jgi:protein-S-isoprenylcysteine O-methyltransferase Ste14
MDDPEETVIGLREDWPATAYLISAITGFAVIIYDFWKIQDLQFNFNVVNTAGILIALTGGIFRFRSRLALRKAGLGILESPRLKVVEDQKLVKDGIYKNIRHPLYLGEILRNNGSALALSSLYGFVLMSLATLFLHFRMGIEEKMLLEEFGEEYRQYMEKTYRLIPYIY